MILATYWPSVHEHDHVGEHYLWTRMHAYSKSEVAREPNPITYAPKLALSGIAALRIAGFQVIFLACDLNSTWTAGESGDQQTINYWCDTHLLINGPKLIYKNMSMPFISHGHCNGGRTSWIDHKLHTGNPGACNAVGEELEDVSDHKPLWGLYYTASLQLHSTRGCPDHSRAKNSFVAKHESSRSFRRGFCKLYTSFLLRPI